MPYVKFRHGILLKWDSWTVSLGLRAPLFIMAAAAMPAEKARPALKTSISVPQREEQPYCEPKTMGTIIHSGRSRHPTPPVKARPAFKTSGSVLHSRMRTDEPGHVLGQRPGQDQCAFTLITQKRLGEANSL
ncbi:hypothetical protein NDU88_000069 [Pleurodeles waltl]|uniref:Uncharacterized protein n=1 Tax=Pleurodeles waltl TaxID=8319 RepID=A0AAV7S6I5_PLEWA|nr:hypothetical protein NDU88_000069 [Pleurodeles waltl]